MHLGSLQAGRNRKLTLCPSGWGHRPPRVNQEPREPKTALAIDWASSLQLDSSDRNGCDFVILETGHGELQYLVLEREGRTLSCSEEFDRFYLDSRW